MLHSHRAIVIEHGAYTDEHGQTRRRDTWRFPVSVVHTLKRDLYCTDWQAAGVIGDVKRECDIGMILLNSRGSEFDATGKRHNDREEISFEIEFVGGDVNEAARRLLDHYTVVARCEA